MPDGDDLAELKELLRTAGVAVVGELVQHREAPHPNTYLGPGKVEELKDLVKSADANLVACDDELSPRQERNLEQALDPTPVVDRTATILDTVAFIRKLPHQLVDAFGATLEETKLADLILHVLDASAPEEERLAMLGAVDDVLEEIGAGDRPRLLVLNKVDALDPDARAELAHRHRDGIMVSALTGEGLDELGDRVEQAFKASMRPMELLLPYAEGARLAELHHVAGEMERTDTPEGVRVKALVPSGAVPR